MNDNCDPRLLRRLKAFALFGSWLTIFIGAVGLAGWVFHIPQFKAVLPGVVAMRANTAIGLILLGAALLLSRTRRDSPNAQDYLARVLALFIAVLGALSLAEYVFHWDCGIDQLLFTDAPATAAIPGRPGLMSPVSSLGFLLLGTALLLLDWRTHRLWLSQLLASAAAVGTITGMLDYLLTLHGTHTRIALQTAIALFFSSTAVLCVRPEWGVGRLLVSRSLGGMVVRRLLPLSVLVPISIGCLRWYAELHGFYSDWGGVALMIVSMIALLAAITGWTAFVIDRTDSERQNSLQQLRISEERFRLLVEGVKDYAIYMLDPQGRVASWNAGAAAITGYGAEEVLGQSCSVFHSPQDKAANKLEHELKEAIVRGRFEERSMRQRKDGSPFWANILIAPLYSGDGKLRGFAKIARDITEQQRAEEQVRKSSRYARSLIEASVDPLVTISKDGKILDVNQATEKATGIPRERLTGSDFSDYFSEPEKARAGYEQVFATGMVRDYPLSLRHTSGSVIDVLYNATVYKNDEGEVEGVFAAARDITARKRAEQEMRRASLYARSLLEASLDPLVTIRKDGKIMDVNQATEAATGIPRERLIGSDFSDYFSEPEKARAGYEQVFATGMVRDYPLSLRHTSGRIMDVVYNATVFKNEAGEVEGVFAAARDVTARKQSENALQHSEQRYRSLVVATSQVIWTTNPQGEVTDDMPMWREFTGQTFEQIQGWGWIEAVHPDDRERTAAIWSRAVANRTLYDTDYRIRRRDGEYRYVAVRGVPVLEADGSIREWIGTCTDVTERRKAEEEIRHLNEVLEQRVIQRTAQLEASNKELEAFTYSVSHDLRAPLRHIAGFAKILVEEYESTLDEDAQHYLRRVTEGVQRMGQLVDDLLNLARVGRKELGLQVTGLGSIVQEVIEELKPETEGRQVQWKVCNLPFVECDPALIKQVFQNLLANALKFTRPRPQAVIEVGRKDENGQTEIFVRDNGVGFSMKYADKLFGVFQRLHRPEDFEGTGVGLATVQRIIAKHGGRIWAEAELDRGATFYFILGGSETNFEKSNIAVAGGQS